VRKQIGAAIFPSGTIIFAKVGAAIFLERKKILTMPSCIDNNMTGYVLDSETVDVRFIHYAMLRKNLGDLVSTTALPSLSGSALSSIEFSIPPLEEQVSIATVLSDMDAEIQALEKRRSKTAELKQGMMQELLTGRTRLV
jgi:type I restriction enzyme S subunit